jgi:hypothetical protein
MVLVSLQYSLLKRLGKRRERKIFHAKRGLPIGVSVFVLALARKYRGLL